MAITNYYSDNYFLDGTVDDNPYFEEILNLINKNSQPYKTGDKDMPLLVRDKIAEALERESFWLRALTR